MNETSFVAAALGLPARQRAHVVGMHEAAILVPKQIFEQNLQRKWQPRDVADSGAFQRIQPENFEPVVSGL